MDSDLKTTPLHQWHKDSGANMADFGGYEMPLWYTSGVKKEHLAVMTSAGIFDTSHMACIRVSGANAFDLLNLCFTRDMSLLPINRCVYGAFLNSHGYCIDDAIVYKFSKHLFMVCVNAGMGQTIAEHLSNQKENFDTVIEDLTGKVAKLDIQGIASAQILSRLIQGPDSIFKDMVYFSFKGNFNESVHGPSEVRLLDGTPVLLSRSGYTGEFGFELFIAPDAIVNLWKDILDRGRDYKVMPCGLGARDSLRAGSCLPLSHQDIGSWVFINHPWEFALPYSADKTGFTKYFIGREALEKNDTREFTYPFVGDSLRKISASDASQVLDGSGTDIGTVLTCATDMAMTWYDNKIVSINSNGLPQDIKINGLSCGFVKVSKPLKPGSKLTLKQGKRTITATIVTDIRPDRTARKKLDNFI